MTGPTAQNPLGVRAGDRVRSSGGAVRTITRITATDMKFDNGTQAPLVSPYWEVVS